MLLFLVNALCNSNYIVIFNTDDNENYKSVYARNLDRTVRYFSNSDSIVNTTVNGYIANLSRATAKKLRNDSSVRLVEKDKEFGIFKVADKIDVFIEEEIFLEEKKISEPWNLGRISGTPKYIAPKSAGEGVTVYVLDTGIEKDHREFKGRARMGLNLVENSPDTDENGHGTHVSGIIAGETVGVARKSELVGVKVLDKKGFGVISRVILGLDYVIREHAKKLEDFKLNLLLNQRNDTFFLRALGQVVENAKYPKTVVNMSVGGLRSKAMEFTIDYANKLGIHFSVAAGNDHDDACEYSPGSSPKVINVGASDMKNKAAFFSNFGICVDVFAPGVDIYSAWIKNTYRINSGTSMASPHVAGVMALFLSEKIYAPDDLFNQIVNDSELVVEPENNPYDNIPDSNTLLPLLSTKKLLGRIQEKSEIVEKL
ncbi:hypothetical protein H312_03419 [Anncaliia algerae PRA339]|uniref:Uncharacterized protein n=1 Tax=Anncaliia algerae PRA339 TaxID=1288291 RepID=A0A059EWS5_9MICR|nr:hypothetical protein H312_03419 [Anncaliia algerae PRA339]